MTGRGLILAAPASGSGKTVITAGLARHLRQRGLHVATAKAGPDFVDPGFHTTATAKPCLNLDVWGMRRETLAGLVTELEAAAEIVLCEGVMGLFDGAGADGETGSTAELAQLTGWPVLLIVDARGQGASLAALLRGFLLHRPAVPLVGVILNRVSSGRHENLLARALARHLPGLACLGALPSDQALILPSRHLGLVPSGEAENAEAVIERSAAQIGTAIDIDRLLALARSSGFAAPKGATLVPPLGQRIAVARDQAFCFMYAALLDDWRRQGAELSFFSPLLNEPPLPSADAVYMPGGYPELWTDRLAAAEPFLAGLRQAAADKKPVYGECGGYMVLGEALVDGGGRGQKMAGLLPLVTSFAEKRLHLGYRCARTLGDTPLGAAGATFRCHEFHYARLVREGDADPLFRAADAAGNDLGRQGLRNGSVFGSFFHLIDCRDRR